MTDEATRERARKLHDELGALDVTEAVCDWFAETAGKDPCHVCDVILAALEAERAAGHEEASRCGAEGCELARVEGVYCAAHGCALCGGIMLADTEDLPEHLCARCVARMRAEYERGVRDAVAVVEDGCVVLGTMRGEHLEYVRAAFVRALRALATPPAASEAQQTPMVSPGALPRMGEAQVNRVAPSGGDSARFVLEDRIAPASGPLIASAPVMGTPTRTIGGVRWTRDALSDWACTMPGCDTRAEWQGDFGARRRCDYHMNATTKGG